MFLQNKNLNSEAAESEIRQLLGNVFDDISALEVRTRLEATCLNDTAIRRIATEAQTEVGDREATHLVTCRRCQDRIRMRRSIDGIADSSSLYPVPPTSCRPELLDEIITGERPLSDNGRTHLLECAPCRHTARELILEHHSG